MTPPCSVCRGRLVPIVYGLPAAPDAADDVEYGGCLIGADGTDPTHRCRGCGWDEHLGEPLEEAHPLFSYYGPRSPQWGRILVIGHEPDADVRMGAHAGPYELAGASRITFWTWSHMAVARAAAIEGLDLRRMALQVANSPMAYSDASPAGFSVMGGKRGKRPRVTNEELELHAQRLVSLPEAAACPLVIVSGRKEKWAPFYDTAVPRFQALGARVVCVPFFGHAPGSTVETLTAPLRAPDVQPIVRAIVLQWAEANGFQVAQRRVR